MPPKKSVSGVAVAAAAKPKAVAAPAASTMPPPAPKAMKRKATDDSSEAVVASSASASSSSSALAPSGTKRQRAQPSDSKLELEVKAAPATESKSKKSSMNTSNATAMAPPAARAPRKRPTIAESDTSASDASASDSESSTTESDFSDLSDSDVESKQGPALTPDQIRGLSAIAREASDKAKAKHRFPDAKAPSDTGAVYLGHIPYGFFETEMKEFFSQFGVVTRLRLARSKRSGNSKGYGFIEFAHQEVAAIVAETMNHYPLFGRTLVCTLVPADKLHVDTFVGGARAFVKIPWRKLAKEQHNQPRTAEQQEKRVKRLLSAESKRRKQLAAAGISYDFKGYAGDQKPKASRKTF